jgi:hypothetical protein
MQILGAFLVPFRFPFIERVMTTGSFGYAQKNIALGVFVVLVGRPALLHIRTERLKGENRALSV